MEIKQVIQFLSSGKIGILPTDTIYGILGSALKPETVEKIYTLRKRSINKPMIILISSINDLERFNIKLTKFQKNFLDQNWPNPLSVVLPCYDRKFEYLHRGTNSLAFRIPKDKNLLEILKKAGPLVAPSANLEGEKPARNTDEARKYFREDVDFYYDKGVVFSNPSTLIEFDNDSVKILRQGIFKVIID